jgi:hypothetical protein
VLATSSRIVKISTRYAVLDVPLTGALLEGMPHERVDPTLVPRFGDNALRCCAAAGIRVSQALSDHRLRDPDFCCRNHSDRRHRARAGVQAAGQHHVGTLWRLHNSGGEICCTTTASEAQSVGSRSRGARLLHRQDHRVDAVSTEFSAPSSSPVSAKITWPISCRSGSCRFCRAGRGRNDSAKHVLH